MPIEPKSMTIRPDTTFREIQNNFGSASSSASKGDEVRFTGEKGLYTSDKTSLATLKSAVGLREQATLREGKREAGAERIKQAITNECGPGLDEKVFKNLSGRGIDISKGVRVSDFSAIRRAIDEVRKANSAMLAPGAVGQTLDREIASPSRLPKLRATDVSQIHATNTCWILTTLMSILNTPGGEDFIKQHFTATDTGYTLRCADGTQVNVTSDDLENANAMRKAIAPAPYNQVDDTRPTWVRAFELAAARACGVEMAVYSAEDGQVFPEALAKKLGVETNAVHLFPGIKKEESFDPKFLTGELRNLLEGGAQVLVTSRGHSNLLSHVDADGTLHLTSTLGGAHRLGEASISKVDADRINHMSDKQYEEWVRQQATTGNAYKPTQETFEIPVQELKVLVSRADRVGNANRIDFLALTPPRPGAVSSAAIGT